MNLFITAHSTKFVRKEGYDPVKQDKQDRRSQRTQRLVNSALLELLFERRYDTITVQDILDRAGIGRSTFYTHYFDKEDVLTSIAEQMLETFDQQFSHREVEQGIIPALELFQHVQQNYQYFQAMMRGNTAEIVWEATQTTLSKLCGKTPSLDPLECDIAVPRWIFSSLIEMVAESRDALFAGTNGEHFSATGSAWCVDYS